MRAHFLLLLTPFIACTTGQAQTDARSHGEHEELGTVTWHRDFDVALRLARAQDKAVLILFQEVPGCATCRNYGHNVLSHPLMVEAIENEFIPLAIFNNKGGADGKVPQRYNEPTWNNPVVRIVDASGADLVERVASDYSALGLYMAMVNALKQQGRSVPGYVELLGKELTAQDRGSGREEYFSMYCFWTGEKHLGERDGCWVPKQAR